jgi:hypothetical protein
LKCKSDRSIWIIAIIVEKKLKYNDRKLRQWFGGHFSGVVFFIGHSSTSRKSTSVSKVCIKNAVCFADYKISNDVQT